MKVKNIIGIIFIGIIYSCGSTLYMPASKDIATQQKLLKGRRIYVDHCSSCHNLHFPKEFNAEAWKKNLDKMQVRAKINDEEKELIFQFLTSQP